MIYLNLILAIRNLLKNKVYSFLIIGGFAIGFAACIIIGLFYHTETTVNHGFVNHRQIHRIYDVKKNRCNLNWDLYPLLISGYTPVEDACPLDYQDREQITIKDEQSSKNTQVKHMLATTGSFFSIFSVVIQESLSGMPFDGKESIAISGHVAKSLFGTQNPLGQKVNIGNYFYGTVTSVFKELPSNSTFQADVILNSENEKFRFSTTTINDKRYNPTNLFVKLKTGTDPVHLADELNRSAGLIQLDIDSLALQRLDDIYLSELTIKSRHAKGNPGLLKIFLAIALLILILSSINYLNYSVSMQYSKFRETGIKIAFGAGWRDLIRYIIVEVSIGILISLILALIIMDMMLPYSVKLFGKELEVNFHDLITVAPFFLLAVITVIMINSFAPLYMLSRFSITAFLSGYGRKGNRKKIWKQVLLTFQLTVSVALITIVIIIYRQLGFVKYSDPGFNNELLMRINIPYKFQENYALRQELEKLSFVSGTTLSSGCPGMINHRLDSNTEENSFTVNCIYVGDKYLGTMGIELLEGRNFLEGDIKKTCLINEEALKKFGWENIEGKRYNILQEGGLEVIGLIKDFKFASYYQNVEPLALIFDGAGYGNVLSVRLRAGNTEQQIDQLSQVWKTLSSDEPFSFIFEVDFFQSFYVKEEKLAGSITFFALIAIALTCMGILGQIFMISLTRVKEIGIRKINGAKVSEVLMLLNRDFVIWFAIAYVIATPVSLLIAKKWLEGFAYRTSLDWWIFAVSGLITLGILLLTVSWQSLRAATRNPVEALRNE